MNQSDQQLEKRRIAILLGAAFAVRLILAALTQGYGADMSCFLAWGEKALQGLPDFYSEGYFADYTPGYIYILAIVAALRRALGIDYYAKASMVLLALVPSICDILITKLVWETGKRSLQSKGRLVTPEQSSHHPAEEQPATACRAPDAAGLWRLAAFTAFCPALLFDTAIWKQIDGAFMLPILCCLLLLEERKYYRSALAFGIALAIKPQALLVGPVMAISFLVPLLDLGKGRRAEDSANKGRNRTRRIFQRQTFKANDSLAHSLLRIPLGILTALVPVLLAGLPFFGFSRLFPDLIDKYTQTSASYAYASVDAFNFFAMLGGNWAEQTAGSPFGMTWAALGRLNLILLTILLVICAFLMWKNRRFSPTLLAAFYTAGVFTFSHRMHERYLLMGVLCCLLAVAIWDDLVLFFSACGLSLTSFLNIACVYATANTDDSFLMSETSQEFMRIVGAVETVFYLVLAVRTIRLSAGRQNVPFLGRKSEQDLTEEFVEKASAKPGVEKAARREVIAVAALTAIAAVMGFTYLGQTKAPQTAVGNYAGTVDIPFVIADSHESTSAMDNESALASATTPVTIRIYPEICWDGTFTVTSDATGEEVVNIPLGVTAVFTWQSATFYGEGEGTHFTAHITNGAVLEAALYDSAGNRLQAVIPSQQAAGGSSALFDEQDLVPQTCNRLNSMYFDEVYHGRTAYEMAHRLTVYETTHPPLGKDLIMLGIILFGMNGFGWRFMPALFGVLLVPLMYEFVKKLTGRGEAGLFAAALFVTDFMRYVESRLATIDIFTTFFILLSAYFMLRFAQQAEEKGIRPCALPALLSGIAFGLGVSVKWNAAYAGLALAAVYFLTLYRRWEADYDRSSVSRFTSVPGAAHKPKSAQTGSGLRSTKSATYPSRNQTGSGKEQKGSHAQTFSFELAFALLYGVLFFICIPFVIYLASYFPYRWKDPSFGLTDWWNCQVAMYQYHSANTATNPFSSNWYTWPLLLRPYWYYADYGLPQGTVSSIASVGNVITWTGGMLCILYLFWKQLRGEEVKIKGNVALLGDTASDTRMTSRKCRRFLLLFYIGQLLPWILVTRTTYIYHYLPIATFGIAAIAAALQDIRTVRIRRLIAITLLGTSALLFVIFFPILSGLPVSSAYGHGLEVLKSWGFYL